MASASPEKCPAFLAFVTDGESLSVLQRFLLTQGLNSDCVQKGTADDAVAYLASHPGPDFLLVEVADAESAQADLDKLADVCDSHVKVIVTSRVDEYSFFRWLTEIGVHHYLLMPLTEEALLEALQSKPVTPETQKAEKQGKLYAVMGTRGGVGASTVALNIAAAIGTLHHTPTALLDLEPQWGTLSLMLDLEPGRGLREALAKPDRIDALFMERVMLKYNDNFAILSSEEPFDEIIAIHEDAARALMSESRKKFGVTVADLPRDLGHFTRDFLSAADHVLIVTELSIVGLRDAMRLNDLLKEKMGLKRVHFIASRTGMLPKHEMPLADFEKSLGAKLYGDVPFDLEAHAKVATGELAVLKKNPGSMGKALIALASQLHRPPAASTTEKKPKLVEWLKGKKK